MNWLLPIQASEHAARIDTIMLLVHALMFALAFGWGAVFVYSLVRFRHSRNPQASYQGARSRFSTYSEIGIVLAELILLVGFSIPAWAMLTRESAAGHEAIAVRVVGEQFMWNVHYPGPDGAFGPTNVRLVGADNPMGIDRASAGGADDITALNELVVPVGRPVVIQLTAKDVIHSFGVPAMRIKQDANPGMVVAVRFTPTVIGEFDVACSQLCGFGHYRMKALLRVVSEEEFRRWLSSM